VCPHVLEATGLAARTFGAPLTDGPAQVSVRQAQDATGQWLLATQDGYVASHGLLHERRLFVDARGQGFVDASSWFWAASLGHSNGPWRALTRVEGL